jgi:hypothetical protein
LRELELELEKDSEDFDFYFLDLFFFYFPSYTHPIMSEPIPGPPGLPILGNINSIDRTDTTTSLCHLADTYGNWSPMIFYPDSL